MSVNKNITIIVSNGEVDPFPTTESTLHTYEGMKNRQLRNYVKRTSGLLKRNLSPISKCVKMIEFENTQKLCFFVSDYKKIHWHNLDNASDDKLTITMLMAKDCHCGCHNCAEQLSKGCCTDEFVIKTIGEIFFPDRYNRQR